VRPKAAATGLVTRSWLLLKMEMGIRREDQGGRSGESHDFFYDFIIGILESKVRLDHVRRLNWKKELTLKKKKKKIRKRKWMRVMVKVMARMKDCKMETGISPEEEKGFFS